MIYVTVPGDTVSSISRQSGVPVWKILYDNQLGEEGKLTVGQALLLLKPQESAGIRKDLYVTGYAYPFIEPYVLEMAFPALNELLVFSYGFTFEGELVPSYCRRDQSLFHSSSKKRSKPDRNQNRRQIIYRH